MTSLRIEPARRLEGSIPVPPEPDTAELALVLAALAPPGRASRIAMRGVGPLRAPAALSALGVALDERDGVWTVAAPERLRPPAAPLDAGRSVTLLASLTALLASQPFPSELWGDAGVVGRHMAAVAATLRHRGGNVEGALDPQRVGVLSPPIRVTPAQLSELSWSSAEPQGDEPSKIAALVSGAGARAATTLAEAPVARRRCERLLLAMGARLRGAGPVIALEPGPLAPLEGDLAADAALAAPLMAAAMVVAGSLITLRSVDVDGFDALGALSEAGAGLHVAPRADRLDAACADVSVRGGALPHALSIGGERARRAGAGLPALAVMATACRGEVRLADMAEPLSPTLRMLEAFGIDAGERDGVLSLGPRRRPRAGTLSAPDPAVAMAASALALAADGPSVIHDVDAIVESFPRFVGSLRALGARIDVSPSPS